MNSSTGGLRASRDIRSLSEFRAHAAAFVEQVQSTSEPMVITQRGRSAIVLLAIAAYEGLLDEVELARDVRTSVEQVETGRAEPSERVETRLRAMLGR
ncbi:MAG TPA: type II toxin-antitoxin system Phd/YefM family antitoxin [Gemmatimonadaceae bacterium]|jgi:prevent-host-death family protein